MNNVYCRELTTSWLRKIENFFLEKLAEAKRRFSTLHAELNKTKESRPKPTLAGRMSHVLTSSQLHHFRFAFSEFYLSLVLLQNFQALNVTGFRKLLKKFDKLFNTTDGNAWREENIVPCNFSKSSEVDKLISDVEQLVCDELESGNHKKAMERLRVPPLDAREYCPWTTYRVGFYSGMFLVLFVINCLVGIVGGMRMSNVPVTIRLFRPYLLLLLHCFLFSLNVYGWRRAGVNHVLIFQLDPRDHMGFQQIMEVACFLAVVWNLCLLAHLTGYHYEISMLPLLAPLVFLGVFVLWLINPYRGLYYSSRMWLLNVLWRLFSAPFHAIEFPDFWLADQLNSLATVFLDLHFTTCFYISVLSSSLSSSSVDLYNTTTVVSLANTSDSYDWLTPATVASPRQTFDCSQNHYGLRSLVLCWPALIRFLQCLRRYRDIGKKFPHLVNAGKYSTTFVVVLFSSLAKSVFILLGMVNRKMKELSKDDPKTYNEFAHYFIYIWIVSALTSTLYAYIWDVKMDWGLFQTNHSHAENKFLREETIYRFKFYYYFAIVADLVLRFGWVLTFSMIFGSLSEELKEIIGSVIAVVEVFRRFLWNFFRLENEHLNNCGEFRAVRDLGLAPIAYDDLDVVSACMETADQLPAYRRHILQQKGGRSRPKGKIFSASSGTSGSGSATGPRRRFLRSARRSVAQIFKIDEARGEDAALMQPF